jgi:hypothetical protein
MGNVFDWVDKDSICLYVPQASLNLYQNANVWGDFSCIIGIDVMSVIEETLQVATSLKMYPNPVSHELHIENANWVSGETIQIFNLSGRLVARFATSGGTTTINVSHLPTSMYILRVGNFSEKFVKN